MVLASLFAPNPSPSFLIHLAAHLPSLPTIPARHQLLNKRRDPHLERSTMNPSAPTYVLEEVQDICFYYLSQLVA